MHLLPFPVDAPRHLLLGCSGGRDSTALLHRLATWCADQGRRLRAVHVDHGLHPASGEWAAHCVATAAALGVPCTVHRVTVTRDGRGLEDAARRARYQAFADERRADECLVLGHHRDDQAETLLLALLRGSGERGLSAMRAFTDDARGPIWRPLLAIAAADVARYADAHALRWIDDPSNADTRLARNAMRHAVMPLLRQHWPAVDAALAHSAHHLAEADAELSRTAAGDVADLQGLAGNTLDAAALRALTKPRAARALRAWAESQGVRLTRDALDRALDEWARHPPGRGLQHALGRHTLRQWGGWLWLTPASSRRRSASYDTVNDGPDAPAWDGRAPLPLRDGGTLTLLGTTRLDAPLRLIPRATAAPRFRAAGDPHSRPLKAVFAALGVPPWARDDVPLLADADGALHALGDLAYAAGFDGWLRARGARLLWQPGAADG